jgi:hypothetical protein
MPTTIKKVAAKKVAVKKVVAKKVTASPKKSAAKKTAGGKVLVYATDAQSFWVHDGQILNSLKSLHDVLGVMEKTIYTHHVTKDRHDFADWVSSVLGDDMCANELRAAKTPVSAKTVVARHLKTYQF